MLHPIISTYIFSMWVVASRSPSSICWHHFFTVDSYASTHNALMSKRFVSLNTEYLRELVDGDHCCESILESRLERIEHGRDSLLFNQAVSQRKKWRFLSLFFCRTHKNKIKWNLYSKAAMTTKVGTMIFIRITPLYNKRRHTYTI